MNKISSKTAVKVIYWNGVAAILIVCLAGISIIRKIHQYDTLIVRISRTHDIDPRLVAAMIWKESRFRPHDVGKAGEIGLMQVTDVVGYEWAQAQNVKNFVKHDLFNPETNIKVGTWYLAKAINYWNRYSDAIPFALAEYNAGRSNAKRWSKNASDSIAFCENITYPTTKRYIKDILERYRGGI